METRNPKIAKLIAEAEAVRANPLLPREAAALLDTLVTLQCENDARFNALEVAFANREGRHPAAL